MDTFEELAVLRREVTVLKRTVDALVEMLQQADAFGAMDRGQVQRRLSAAARIAREDEEQREDEEAEAEEPPALVESAYRGVTPGAGGLACAICRKALAEDDPELILNKRGKVCVSCFHRGANR
jgi:hypothetical protein